MGAFRQKRAWFWIAIAAIAIALIAFLVPQGHGPASQPAWMVMLPVFFIGIIFPLSLAPLSGFLLLGRAPESPSLAPSFQRPPPSHA